MDRWTQALRGLSGLRRLMAVGVLGLLVALVITLIQGASATADRLGALIYGLTVALAITIGLELWIDRRSGDRD